MTCASTVILLTLCSNANSDSSINYESDLYKPNIIENNRMDVVAREAREKLTCIQIKKHLNAIKIAFILIRTNMISYYNFFKIFLTIAGLSLSFSSCAQISEEYLRLEKSKKILIDGSFVYKCSEILVGFYNKDGAQKWNAIIWDHKFNFISVNEASLSVNEDRGASKSSGIFAWSRNDRTKKFEFIQIFDNEKYISNTLYVKEVSTGNIAKTLCQLYKSPFEKIISD